MALWAGRASADFDAEPCRIYEGYLVTAVDITGFNVTKEYVIRREIRTHAGEPFRCADAQADLTRLENIGIFSSCELIGEAGDSTVALTFRVREMPWIVPYPKFHYTEEDGWSFGGGVASINMLGRGARLSASVLLGGVDSWYLHYRYPWITGNHISADIYTANLTRDDNLNGFKERSFEATPWFGTWIGDTGRAAFTLSYFQMKADRDSITLSDDRRDLFLRAGGRIGYDSRDNWRNASNGWYSDALFMRYDGGAFGRRGGWWLTELDVRRYQTIAPRQSVVLGGLLSTQHGQVGSDIPGYFQYRMGGANSIRGYDIEKLGEELFGRNQSIATMEYQYVLIPMHEHFLGKWSYSAGIEAAAFVDWGIAWNGSDEFEPSRARTGFGVGLRWLLPAIYEIRTDVAIGEDGKVFFHLGVGEKFNAQRLRVR